MPTDFISLLFFTEISNFKKSKNPMGIFPVLENGKNPMGKIKLVN